MSWQEKARAVAHYRVHNLIDAHVQDAISSYIDQKQH